MSASVRAPVLERRNRILSALSDLAPAESASLARSLEPSSLEMGQEIARPGEPFRHVYFPETAIISVVSRMANGAAVEVGTIGNEGMAGITAFLGVESSINDTFVQVPGMAARAEAAAFVAGMRDQPVLRALMQRYTHAYLTQIAQTAACNGLHGIESRCARWLLMTHDRVGEAPRFALTHEYLAMMLGVRRSGVTVAAGALRRAGLIRYSRGTIRVLDRAGLEAAACECYGVVRRHFDDLLGDPRPAAERSSVAG